MKTIRVNTNVENKQLPPSYSVKDEDENNDKEQNNSVQGLWITFRSNTTMHGLRHASEINHCKARR